MNIHLRNLIIILSWVLLGLSIYTFTSNCPWKYRLVTSDAKNCVLHSVADDYGNVGYFINYEITNIFGKTIRIDTRHSCTSFNERNIKHFVDEANKGRIYQKSAFFFTISLVYVIVFFFFSLFGCVVECSEDEYSAILPIHLFITFIDNKRYIIYPSVIRCCIEYVKHFFGH